MNTMTTATGLEVRLYPNVVEFWQNGQQMLAMSPQEYGEVMRWIEGTLHHIAAAPWREEP